MKTRGRVLLDGGMGHMLRRKGVEIKGEIGSMERFLGVALANIDNPKLVTDSHLEYLDAGCEIITKNSYSCVPAALSLATKRSVCLNKIIGAAGKLARASVDSYMEDHGGASGGDCRRRVAGCIPPLAESYRADRVLGDEALSADYEQIVKAIAPYSDLLLCETMSAVREARAAANAAAKCSDLPVWVAWTLHEDGSGNLRSGESIEDAVMAIKNIAAVEGCLLNCCTYESICAAIPRLREAIATHFPEEQASKVQVGAYGNAFITVAEGAAANGAQQEYKDLSPEEYAAQATVWQGLGATIIGGCCGVFPEHMRAVHDLANDPAAHAESP